MEAPDSPPEQQAPLSPSFSPVAPNSSQQASASPRANGDKAAKVDFGSPGSSYNNKKFNDDYDRAESSLLDRNWDHSECEVAWGIERANNRIDKYGDPLLVNTGS